MLAGVLLVVMVCLPVLLQQGERVMQTEAPTPPQPQSKTIQPVAATDVKPPEMVAIPGVVAFPSSPPPLGQGIRDKPIQMVIGRAEGAQPFQPAPLGLDHGPAGAGLYAERGA